MNGTTPTAADMRLNPDLCTGCAWCVDECEGNVLGMDGDVAAYVRPEQCTGCGNCISTCPSEAISPA